MIKPKRSSETSTLAGTLGQRIRLLRISKGLKISDIAKATALTSSTISQVERAIISPSISTLKKICDALGASIGYLFEAADVADLSAPPQSPERPVANDPFLAAAPVAFSEQPIVVHKENRKILIPREGTRYHLLTPNLQGPFEFIYNEFEPKSGTGNELYTHQGIECGLILSGELTIQIEENVYVLHEGDSITFQSSKPHRKDNCSSETCTSIWVNYPPSF
jgi:transcriptional regulator with XRE-family HTH domain